MTDQPLPYTYTPDVTSEELTAHLGPDPARMRHLMASEQIKDAAGEDYGSKQEMYALRMAQVHATLALVEEQRTANLIQWSALTIGMGEGDVNLPGLIPVIEGRLGL